LNRRPIVSQLWNKGIFHLSKTDIEDLMRMATESDFAALLLTPDDMTANRGTKKASPRDNTVFELGLFMGALGRDRAFIVTPKGVDLKLPTDLLGMTHLQYAINNNKTLGKRMAPVSRALWNRIKQLGAK
jgi:predicted nucleotide-binding protein